MPPFQKPSAPKPSVFDAMDDQGVVDFLLKGEVLNSEQKAQLNRRIQKISGDLYIRASQLLDRADAHKAKPVN